MSRQGLAQLPASVGETPDWTHLYWLGGVTALVVVLLGLLDVVSTFLPTAVQETRGLAAADWFKLCEGNWFEGLRNLGLLNVLNDTLAIPTFLAILAVHRKTDKGYAALAVVLWIVGTAIYVANNPAVPMFVLSAKYAAATTEAQRSLLSAAGETVLALGEDFTPGAFIGFLLPEIAGLIISCVMWRGKVFSKGAAIAGILGLGAMLIYTALITFVPALFDAALALATVGGLSSLAWYVMIARKLFQLGRSEGAKPSRRPAVIA